MKKQKNTLLFLYKPETRQILLALKKRGFGEGKWNGVGGKVEENESVELATIREVAEEIGVIVQKENLQDRGIIQFSFEDASELNRNVQIFFTEKWKGDPIETEEMRPQWFDIDEIPYTDMWIDDIHWLPKALAGKRIRASFHLSASGDEILAPSRLLKMGATMSHTVSPGYLRSLSD